MTPRRDDEDRLRSFLLGRLAPEERDDMESRLLSDDALFWQRLSLAEDDLVDDYVCDGLDDDERNDFERRYLCTDVRRSGLEFARALHAYVERSAVRESEHRSWLTRPIVAPAWAAAAAAVLLLAAPAAVWRYAQPGPPGGAQSAGTRIVTSSTLSPGLTRAAGAELERIRIGADTVLVRLTLDVGADSYEGYRATLHDVDGRQLLAVDGVTPAAIGGGLRVAVAVPAESLPEGDYFVRLHGLSAHGSAAVIGRYDFRVLRN